MDLAIIPARSGSKRIPKKNIKEFDGFPIIKYSIDVALKCGLFDKVVVSTDDSEIAKVANYYGAVTPFVRPQNLADDLSSTADVISHAITNTLGEYENICCIYPCAPFLEPSDLIKAREMLSAISDREYVFPVGRYQNSILRSLKIDERGRTSCEFEKYAFYRTQDIDASYYDAGQFYYGRRDAWLQRKAIFKNGIAMVVPRIKAIDIDEHDDWEFAEAVYKTKK